MASSLLLAASLFFSAWSHAQVPTPQDGIWRGTVVVSASVPYLKSKSNSLFRFTGFVNHQAADVDNPTSFHGIISNLGNSERMRNPTGMGVIPIEGLVEGGSINLSGENVDLWLPSMVFELSDDSDSFPVTILQRSLKYSIDSRTGQTRAVSFRFNYNDGNYIREEFRRSVTVSVSLRRIRSLP